MKVIGRCKKCGCAQLVMLTAVFNETTGQGHGTAICTACGELTEAKASEVKKLKDGTLIEKEKLN